MTFAHKSVKNVVLGVAIIFCGVSAVAVSAPAVQQVNVTDGDEFANGSIVVVRGKGFGVKENAAPVLHDLVSHAFENGRLNTINSRLSSFDDVPTDIVGDSSPLWAAKSNAFYRATDLGRHPGSKFVYYLEGHNAWLGRPVAYGGAGGWDTPTDNAKMYAAWWLKTAYDPAAYWRVSPEELTGTFEPGERISLGDGIHGQYIETDSEGLLNLTLFEFGSINFLRGKKITGLTSNATTTFPVEPRRGAGYGFESPGSQKYLRIWEHPSGKEGYRFSWTQMHQTGFNEDEKPHWVGTPLAGGEWHLMEFEIDTDKRQIRTGVNGNWHPPLIFREGVLLEGELSPTIALVGLNGKTGKFQETEISEFYMDSSLNRVMLGNSPFYDDVTHLELQRPSKWSNNEIEFELGLGALSKRSDMYLYIFDENGIPNQAGYRLSDGRSPPKKVELEIQ